MDDESQIREYLSIPNRWRPAEQTLASLFIALARDKRATGRGRKGVTWTLEPPPLGPDFQTTTPTSEVLSHCSHWEMRRDQDENTTNYRLRWQCLTAEEDTFRLID